jgi:hypothetical protein
LTVLRRPIALSLGVAASAIVWVSLAHAAVPRDVAQLGQACNAAAKSIQMVVAHAATTQVQVITAQLKVAAPGTVTGRITFNPSGSMIQVAGDTSTAEALGCATGTASHGIQGRRGHSQVVSTLRQTLTAPGRYTLTFDLNAAGRRILARLGARQRAYRRHHPHGSRPPSIGFGVGLTYVPTS